MSHRFKRHHIRGLASVLVIVLLLGQVPAGSQAAPPTQAGIAPAMLDTGQAAPPVPDGATSIQPAAPAACPPAPADLPDIIERADFCVYYKEGTTSNYSTGVLTAADAILAADYVEDYWERYETDFGFLAPLVTDTKLEVRLERIGSCNGSAWENYIKAYTGCYNTPESIQKVLGHELFHRVQFNYDSDWDPNWSDIAWLYEGTARAMEDNAFDNIDNWPTALTAVSSSFNKQVNTYLASTNADITTWDMRYNSALWWKYFTEQYGTTPTEPELGVDAFLALWQAVTTASDIAAVNNALSALGAGTNFNEAFRRFAVTNWTKDLTGVPDDSYNYIDEEQTGNPDTYGPLTPASGGTINIGTPANWNNQSVARYGARYYHAQPGTNCPVISASFHKDSGPHAFYHVVTQKDSAFDWHVEGSATDWTQSFLNDGITDIVAVIGSRGSSSQVDVSLSCADPVVDIRLPNDVAVAYVQPSSKFLAQVLVTNGSPTGPVVSGLTNSDFKAKVNGVNALVTAGGFIQEQYWLVVQAPASLTDGTYDLEIILEEPDTTTPIASDTNADSIVYTSDKVDHVLVIDRSGSMGWGTNPRLPAAQDAANFYIDITRNDDGLAVVPYHYDVDPAPFDMESVDLTVRNDAKDYVLALTAGSTTSIGDGLQEAVNQRAGSPTGNPNCSFVLLSDGMENTSLFWIDVQTDVVDSGCPVTSIAFGPESDETLMQDIATATGGASFYNDVYVSAARAANAATPADVALELGGNYEYAQARGEGRQRLLWERGEVSRGMTGTHQVLIDDTISEVLFALDWYETYYAQLELKLRKPDGTIIDEKALPYTFEDHVSKHMGWRIADPDPGEWEMLVRHVASEEGSVPYQVLASGHSNLTLELLLPDRLGMRFFTGNRIPIYAFLSADEPIPGALVEAIVTAPDGTETAVPLHDDGQHDDGAADDGFYANTYTRVNQAAAVEPSGEDVQDPPPPNDEAGYRVRLRASDEKFQREALGSFSVLEGDDDDQDGLPDPFEEEHDVDDPDADPDLDLLDNLSEYLSGTDPNDSDTDDGGEGDGSEVLFHDQDPLDPADDEIEAPDFFHAAPANGAVVLTYDVKGEYAEMVLYRADDPAGPWDSREPELPLTGVYSDTASNGETYFYRLVAKDADPHWSAVLDSEAVTPSSDPVPPQGLVIINDGALSTSSLSVTLSFAPYESVGTEGDQSFDDIVEMLISNDPFFPGAEWQPFAQDVPWRLDAERDEIARVYVRFRDDADNESVGTEVGMILYEPMAVFLPLVLKQ